MGDRGQVEIIDGFEDEEEKVYLYTHWEASSLIDTVRKALSSEEGRNRWDDSEYLARIIFDHMTGLQGGELGFGISASRNSDVWRVVTVNTGREIVSVEDGGKVILTQSFEEFVKCNTKLEI